MYEERFEDEVIVCNDCKEEFVFSARDKAFYAEKGYVNKPVRCKKCRDARKLALQNAENGVREYHTGVCAGCGKEARVPFKPINEKPIYCSECFAKMKNKSAE